MPRALPGGLLTAVIIVASVACPAQMQLVTTYAAGNGQSGNMFDLEATGGTPLIINSFDVHTTAVGITVEVYAITAGTTFVGNEVNAAAWTMLTSVSGINGAGTGSPTPLNLALNYTLPVGGPVGFYVTSTGPTLSYTNGTAVGNVAASDAYLTCYEGVGKSYPFGSTFTTRIFNGTIHYDLAQNQLSMTQDAMNNLTVSLDMPSPAAMEGFTFVSFDTTFPVSQGPFLGIFPDAGTWDTFAMPYVPSSPFRFQMTDPAWPNTPIWIPGGLLAPLSGQTADFVIMFLNPSMQYDSRSNVVRITFQ